MYLRITLKSPTYIYTYKRDIHYDALCKLECRQLFGQEGKNGQLFSETKIDPSISPFLRARFQTTHSARTYPELLVEIEKAAIHQEDFKAEYTSLYGDPTTYEERLDKLRDVGLRIEGDPDFTNPSVMYTIGFTNETWYFGILTKHDRSSKKHQKKPCSFSNSIGITIGKTLVTLSSKGDKSKTLLDGCCGVGTVVLEAYGTGFNIEGNDINWKSCKNARQNLVHFGYETTISRSDIKDLDKQYDAIIIDLPYNIYAYSDDEITANIIESAALLAPRMVIVSVADISAMIQKTGFKITDAATVDKRGAHFTRRIWVCEKA